MPPPTRENALDLPLRRRIYEAVESSPGLHMRALAAQLDMAVSSIEYHLYHLVRTGHLATRESGGFKAYYLAEGIDRRDKDILYLIRQDAVRKVCADLALNEGATPKEIRGRVGMSAPTLSFHLKKLREAGLIEETAEGRTKRVSLVDPERVANLLVTYRASFMDGAVDRFAKTWLSLNRP